MPAAPLPLNEAARLEALRSYRLLDTDPERAYDEIASLASTICSVPIALVTLVDSHRQFLKARVGLDVVQTPREHAFCAQTVLHEETLVVEDALCDERFADNPLVTGAPHIRFYAGSPLLNQDGHALGSLCVIDTKPRKLSQEQARALKILARQVVAHMELQRTANQLAAALDGLHRLEGLLPICAWCKKVRSDDGYWHAVEDYLRAQTGASMTHGMCPSCFEKETSALE